MNPEFIKLAVLLDRGGRELPIEAQYTAQHIDVEGKYLIKFFMRDKDDREEAVLKPLPTAP